MEAGLFIGWTCMPLTTEQVLQITNGKPNLEKLFPKFNVSTHGQNGGYIPLAKLETEASLIRERTRYFVRGSAAEVELTFNWLKQGKRGFLMWQACLKKSQATAQPKQPKRRHHTR